MKPLPIGFSVELRRGVLLLDGGRLLVGGRPLRALRLTDAGGDALASLRAGTARSASGRALGRRLVDAGLAAPVPPSVGAQRTATVVVPVRDRADDLDRCLGSLRGRDTVVVVDDGSRDPTAMRAVAQRHGASVVRREEAGGPAAARNAALPHVHTDMVAFLDSDCVAPEDFIGTLARHFEDPLVAAVAPRVVGARLGASAVARYAASRCPLDLGSDPGLVRPDGAVPYVPTAALLVRRDALGAGFDEALRQGEDVDFIWRLCDAGRRVVYDPSVVVLHREPPSLGGLLARRFRYGTAAAALSASHGDRVAHVVVAPLPTSTVALVLARRPVAAAVTAAVATAAVHRRTRAAGLSVRAAARVVARTTAETVLGLSRVATTVGLPLTVGSLIWPRTRSAGLGLLLVEAAVEWRRRRPQLGPVMWTVTFVADNTAYGAGVWSGSIRRRSTTPLRPLVRPLRRSPHDVPTARKEGS